MSSQATSSPRWLVALVALVVVLGALAPDASAGPVFVIDFEDLAVSTDGEPLSELAVLVPDAFGDEPVRFLRESADFDVIDLSQRGPAPGFGSRSLSSDRDLASDGLLAIFPGKVQAVAVEMGGFGTETLHLQLGAATFNEADSERVRDNLLLPPAADGGFRSGTVSVRAGGSFDFAYFEGDTVGLNVATAYVDNLRFELVDAPGNGGGNGGGTPVIPLPPAVLSFPLAALVAYVAGKRRHGA